MVKKTEINKPIKSTLRSGSAISQTNKLNGSNSNLSKTSNGSYFKLLFFFLK